MKKIIILCACVLGATLGVGLAVGLLGKDTPTEDKLVDTSIVNVKTYSTTANETYESFVVVENEGTTLNGGGSVVVNGSEVTLTNMYPGDTVEFEVQYTNETKAEAYYQAEVRANGLTSALTLTVDGEELDVMSEFTRRYDYQKLAPEVSDKMTVSVFMPFETTAEYIGKTVKLSFGANGSKTEQDNPMNDEEVAEYLLQDEKEIVFDMYSSITLTTSDEAVFGGETTETVTINGNGNTLYLDNQKYNRLTAVNADCKVVLNDIRIRALNQDQTALSWTIYQINFLNETELNNAEIYHEVTFNAPGKEMKLNNVTIQAGEFNDIYAVWIATGTNVELNNCKITSELGRAIKVSDQYVTELLPTRIVAKNVKFSSAKKSAILLGCAEGATVTLENIDISGVTADNRFAVWVDSDVKESMSKVVVNGGLYRYEDSSLTVTE